MDKPINIHISATADTKVLKAATKEIKDQAHELKNSATNVAKAWADAGQKMSKVVKEHAKAVKALTPPGSSSTPVAKKTSTRRSSSNAQPAPDEPALISSDIPSESPRARTSGSAGARKAAAAKVAAAKKVAAKKAAAKKAAAKKTAARRDAAKKAAAKKAAVKQAAAKKAAVRREAEKRAKAQKKERAAAKAAAEKKKQSGEKSASQKNKPGKKGKDEDKKPKSWSERTHKMLNTKWSLPDPSYGGMTGLLPPQIAGIVGLLESGAKVVGRWIEGNEKLSKSFGNLTAVASTFTDSVLQEWLGEGDAVRGIMDKITTALGGQTEAMKEINRPLGMYKRSTDLAKDAQEKFNDELKKEQTLLDDLAGKLANQLAIQQQQLKTAEAQAEFRAEDAHAAVDASKDDDTTKERKHLEIERQLLNNKLNFRMQERNAELAPEVKELQARKELLKRSEEQLVVQRERAKLAGDLKLARLALAKHEGTAEEARGPNFERVLNKARDRVKNLEKGTIGLGTDEQEGNNMVALEESIKSQKADIKPLQQQVDTNTQLVDMQNGQDAYETNREIAELNLKMDALSGKSAGPPLAQTSVDEVNTGLDKLDQTSKDPEANLKIEALRKSFNDGQGNQQEEAALIQNLLANMTENSAANKALLNQTLSQMNNLQADGSKMQQALTGVLNGLIQNQRELANSLQGMQNQVNNQDAYLRR